MYEEILSIKYGIIYDTTYGCIKKYRCADSMWILYVLAFTHTVTIYRQTNAPVYGRSKIYGINGADKKYLKQKRT